MKKYIIDQLSISGIDKALQRALSSNNVEKIEIIFNFLYNYCTYNDWDLGNPSHELAHDMIEYIGREFGKEWDDLDPQFPNNTFNWGYECFGREVVLGYSGVCGRYWSTIIRV